MTKIKNEKKFLEDWLRLGRPSFVGFKKCYNIDLFLVILYSVLNGNFSLNFIINFSTNSSHTEMLSLSPMKNNIWIFWLLIFIKFSNLCEWDPSYKY